jgi:hypothetical protein
MEYAEVAIHRDEETRAKSIPRASTLNLIATPGMTSAIVYTISVPFRIVGTMEATMRNFAAAAIKVHASRTFGALLVTSIGTTKREAKTARSGFIDIICSIL